MTKFSGWLGHSFAAIYSLREELTLPPIKELPQEKK